MIEYGQDTTQRLDNMLDLKRFVSTLENKDACIYCLKTIEGLTYQKIADFMMTSSQKVRRSIKETEDKYFTFFKK
jgi:DNA-directed RNA polymerase specialized sigma24 family protein